MIIIGERVNATRKSIREAIESRDTAAIQNEIVRQDKAGSDYIDLNAGTGSGDIDREKKDLCWLVDCALGCTEKKLALDSSDPAAIQYAAEHLAGRRPWMLNSVKADSEELLDEGLALSANHSVPVIALAMDKDGIPRDSQRRLEICEMIREKAAEKGVPDEHLYFDPLVLPISADISQGMVTFETLRKIKERYPKVRTTMGLSNVSHGLKKRLMINSSFLSISIGYGLDSAICDPGKPEIKRSILLAELLMGKDRHCRRFSRAVRSGIFDNEKGGA